MPSVVNFANAAYTVNQNVVGGTLHVGLTLDAASANTVSLEVISAAFADGDNAAEGVDYTAVDQFVSFTPGDTTATVPVTILINTAATGDVNFHLCLLGPIENGTAGDTSTTAIAIHVPNPAPSLANPGLQSANEGDSYSLQIAATAPAGGGNLSYSASGLLAGLSVNTSTGLISGTVGYSAGETSAGNYWVTIGAQDTAGAASSATFLMLIGDTNRPPTVTNPGSKSGAEGDAVSLPIGASDPDSDPLSYSASGLPGGLAIDPSSGLISGTVTYNDYVPLSPGNSTSYSVTVTASDGQASASQTFSWSVANTNRLDNPGDQTVSADQTVSLQLHATDATGEPLSYTGGPFPTGLTLNSVTGLISGTVMYHTGMSYMSLVEVTGGGDSDSQTFFWTVSMNMGGGGMPGWPPTNHPPIISSPGEQDNGLGNGISLQIAGSDPDSDTLSYSASGLPLGLSMSSSSGLISGTISASANVTTPYSVAVTVTDAGGLSESTTFSWLIHQVTISVPGGQTFYVGDDVSLSVTGSDSQGATVHFAATGLPDGLGINAVTGAITGTLTEPAVYHDSLTYVVTLIDFNAFGQQAQAAMNLVVKDFTVTISPDPIKTGYLNRPPALGADPDSEKLKRKVTATVSDPAKVNDLTFKVLGFPTAHAHVKKVSTSADNTTINLEVIGDSATPGPAQTYPPLRADKLQALYKGKLKASAKVIVVVPASIKTGTYGPTTVDGVNLAQGKETAPADPSIPAGKVALVTGYGIRVPMTVNDQFGLTLDPIYDGQAVSENIPNNPIVNINVSLLSGHYDDWVGVTG